MVRVCAALLAAGLVLVAGACGGDLLTDNAVEEASARASAPEIATLVFRDQALRIHADGRFTLLDGDGTVIAQGLTEAELAEVAPHLVRGYRQMVAGQGIDASVYSWDPAEVY